MEELEIKKLRRKTLTVVLYEEGNSQASKHSDCFKEQEENPLVNVILAHHPDFVTADKDCMFGADGQNVKVEEFRELGVPLFKLGIPQNARMYMEQEIVELREKIKELKEELERFLAENPKNANTYKGQNLKSLIEFYEREADEKEEYLNTVITARWIVKQLIDLASEVPEREVTSIHITPPKLFEELAKQMSEADIVVLPMRSPLHIKHDELVQLK
ncbi:MAG: hypothetical protein QW279_11130 [Candidatus Jordarchaeaceae archaeon]